MSKKKNKRRDVNIKVGKVKVKIFFIHLAEVSIFL